MVYHLLADLVVLAHFGFIAFVSLGGLLAFRWHWIPWAHIPAVLWGGYVELAGRICPLTPLENLLRRAGGEAEYAQSFVERYIVPIVYPYGLTREVQIVMAVSLIGLNILIYAYLIWHRRNRTWK